MGRLRGRASKHLRPGTPEPDPQLVVDLLDTWFQYPHAFVRGCGQETMQHWVRDATSRHYSCKDIRRALLWAVSLNLAVIYAEDGRVTRFNLDPKGQ